jgi:microcystin-dependent protein
MSQTVAQLVSGSVTTPLAPPGSVVFVAQNTPPTGWLKANGAEVSRTVYSALFAAINTTFGAGDGSTTFTLPDLRGEFPRGWDDSRGIDSGRAFGSAQADAMQGHYHNFFSSNASDGGSGSGERWESSGTYTRNISSRGGIGAPLTDGTNGTPRTAAETRSRNVALLACIKF